MDVYLYYIIYSIKYHNINVYGMNIIYIYIYVILYNLFGMEPAQNSGFAPLPRSTLRQSHHVQVWSWE